MLRSLEQERAKYAWECVSSLKAENKIKEDEKVGLFVKIIEENKKISEDEIKKYYAELEKRYSSYVKRISTLIKTNGLGSTLAFYKSKFGSEEEAKLSADKRAYKLIYDHIDGWFKKQFKYNDDILKWITTIASSIEVFQVTKEIIALLNWMKRFAEAELKEE